VIDREREHCAGEFGGLGKIKWSLGISRAPVFVDDEVLCWPSIGDAVVGKGNACVDF
jgi:hypothetical protein